jgi:hypothetical protein
LTITRLLESDIGFKFEPRSADTIPDGYQLKAGDISWFLNSYENQNINNNEKLIMHVDQAIKDINVLK